MVDGHIHLARKILEGDLCPKGRFSRFEAWIYLLLNANGITKKWQGILIERGTLPTYQVRLASEWKWSIGNVNKFLKYLKSESRIETKPTNKFTLIKILNYDKFNPLNETKSESKVKANENQSESKVKLHNKDNKDNKDNKENNTKVLVAKPQYGNEELNKLIEFGKQNIFPLQGTIQLNRNCASNLLKKFGLEKSKWLVKAAVECRGKPYSPTVSDFNQLYKKTGDLITYYAKNNTKKGRNYDK